MLVCLSVPYSMFTFYPNLQNIHNQMIGFFTFGWPDISNLKSDYEICNYYFLRPSMNTNRTFSDNRFIEKSAFQRLYSVFEFGRVFVLHYYN